MPDSRTPFTIRTASEEDLPVLYAIARRAMTLDRFSEHLLAEKLFKRVRPDAFTWEVHVAEHAGRPIGFMQSVARPAAAKAWVGLSAVEEEYRRRGAATALLEHARARWPSRTTEVEALAIPGNYFAPGLDPRYTAGLCFLERLGFERFRDCVNLLSELSAEFDTASEGQRLAREGITVRRARLDDKPALDQFFEQNFGEDWRFEAGLAMENDPPALHLALQGETIIAFSAHSSQNREWGFFGPMGTTPAARGKGVGRVLLWHCLNDLRAAGHRTSVIPWVGPISFYHQWAGSVVDRVYWRYRLTLK